MVDNRGQQDSGEDCVSSSTCLARMDGIKESVENKIGKILITSSLAIILTMVGVSWDLSRQLTTLQDVCNAQGKEIIAQGKQINRIEEYLKIPPAVIPSQSYTDYEDPSISRKTAPKLPQFANK